MIFTNQFKNSLSKLFLYGQGDSTAYSSPSGFTFTDVNGVSRNAVGYHYVNQLVASFFPCTTSLINGNAKPSSGQLGIGLSSDTLNENSTTYNPSGTLYTTTVTKTQDSSGKACRATLIIKNGGSESATIRSVAFVTSVMYGYPSSNAPMLSAYYNLSTPITIEAGRYAEITIDITNTIHFD